MLVGSMYCGWTLVILVLFHREAFERSIGDALDHVYKQMGDYETRIAGDHEIASLSLRYTRTTYTVMLAVAGSLFLGAYATGQLLGFRKIVCGKSHLNWQVGLPDQSEFSLELRRYDNVFDVMILLA